MNTYCMTTPPQKDPSIKPLQTALKTAGLYKGKVDGVFGWGTGDACHVAKWRFGYPKKQVNRCGGQTLLDYLTGKKELSVAYRTRRKLRGYGLSKQEVMRNKIVEFALWGIANSAQIHYGQTRPMENIHNLKKLPWTADCSEDVTTYYCWAGAPDPNGSRYNGLGYTGSMLDHGTSIALHQALKGDLVIFGPHPGHHVVLLLQDGVANGGDPDVSSHGQEAGPIRLKLSDEAAAQPKPYTVKRYISPI